MSGHGCRAQLWSILGAIALLYMCGGIFFATSASNVTISEADKLRSRRTLEAQGIEWDEEAFTAGTGIARAGIVGVGVPFFLCSGLPFVLIFGLLANANRRAIREEKRHQQALAVQQQQFAAMQQTAQAQAVQAQMQFANFQQQQSQPPSPAPQLSAPYGDVRAQLELAREMIQEKNYTGARKLLKTINHPKATEWLQKLDQMNV